MRSTSRIHPAIPLTRPARGRAHHPASRGAIRHRWRGWLLLPAMLTALTACANQGDPVSSGTGPDDAVLLPVPPPPEGAKKGPWVVIKVDDMAHDLRDPGAMHPRWQAFFELQAELGIPVAVGVEGWSLESGKEGYFDALRSLVDRGWVELYNHGFTHSLSGTDPSWRATTEFRGTPCSFQREHLLRTQDLLRKNVGVTSIAFGAPGNAGDDSTVCALRAAPEIRIWFAGRPGAGTTNLPLSPCEAPLPHPNFDRFRAGFDAQARVVVLQIHPASWVDAADAAEFRRIIDFLRVEGAHFATLAQVANRDDPPGSSAVTGRDQDRTALPGPGRHHTGPGISTERRNSAALSGVTTLM